MCLILGNVVYVFDYGSSHNYINIFPVCTTVSLYFIDVYMHKQTFTEWLGVDVLSQYHYI